MPRTTTFRHQCKKCRLKLSVPTYSFWRPNGILHMKVGDGVSGYHYECAVEILKKVKAREKCPLCKTPLKFKIPRPKSDYERP